VPFWGNVVRGNIVRGTDIIPFLNRFFELNRRSGVRIPPGSKVFRPIYIAVMLSKLTMHCHCLYLRKINTSTKIIK
jgi:hypothetical protein